MAFLLRGFVNQVKAQMQDTEKQLDVSFWSRTHLHIYVLRWTDEQDTVAHLHIFTLLHSVCHYLELIHLSVVGILDVHEKKSSPKDAVRKKASVSEPMQNFDM